MHTFDLSGSLLNFKINLGISTLLPIEDLSFFNPK